MNTSFERTDKNEDWITPPNIVNELGCFDLDPCASHHQSGFYAENNFTIDEDGLNKKWEGRVWCNPPYGRKTEPFIKKLAEHGNGIALIFARIDTKLWHETIFRLADAIFVFKGRLKFYHLDKETNNLIQGDCAGAGSCLIAFGKNNVDALCNTTFKGHFIKSDMMEINQVGTKR